MVYSCPTLRSESQWKQTANNLIINDDDNFDMMLIVMMMMLMTIIAPQLISGNLWRWIGWRSGMTESTVFIVYYEQQFPTYL